MPLHTLDQQTPAERAPTAYFDRVPKCFHAAGLADHTSIDSSTASTKFGQDFDHTVDGRSFLVAGQHNGNRSSVRGRAGHETLASCDHGGDTALHIGSATSVQALALDARLEGIALPLRHGSGRHDIGVAQKH